MSREFGFVKTSVWGSSKKFRSINQDARFLYLYLNTCPHGNAAGCFVLPPGYALHDLMWDDPKAFSKAIAALVDAGLVGWDPEENVVRVVNYLKQRPITNTKHGMGAVSAVRALPDCEQKRLVCEDLAQSQFVKKEEIHSVKKTCDSSIDRQSEVYPYTGTGTETKTDTKHTPPNPPRGGPEGKSKKSEPVLPDALRDNPPPAWWDHDAWDEWAEYRRKHKRKKITSPAANKQFRKLEAWCGNGGGWTMRQLVDEAIRNDWQSLYEPKIRAGPYPKKHPSGYTAPPEPEDTRTAEEMAADILDAVQYLRGNEDFERWLESDDSLPRHFIGAVNRISQEIERYESKFGGDPLPADSRQWINVVFERVSDAEHA